jgi:hypothetical protein
MSSHVIYRTLVPNAPLHRRTEGDELRGPLFASRARANLLLTERAAVPALQEPSLVSTFSGSIDRILFCFPSWGVDDPELSSAYRSVIGALRVGTKFIAVHHDSTGSRVAEWFTSAGHAENDVLLVGVPDYVSLTDWAEDAYVAVEDAVDHSRHLVEPWEFLRAGDALIADAVENHSEIRATQAPLIFQGGNCLIGSDFWLLGKDYFVDTLDLLSGQRPPVAIPAGKNPEAFARELFTQYVDRRRNLISIGTSRPIAAREYVGTRSGGEFYLDLVSGGAGTFQPIFHIDMFITLVGLNPDGRFELLVGSPALADQMLGTTSPFALAEVYDDIAAALAEEGFSVRRNPLVHRATIAQSLPFSQLAALSTQPGYEALATAVQELSAAGASGASEVKVRDWHHVTWNNCLVENSSAKGKHVYMPSFGHAPNADLKAIDEAMRSLWTELGFSVHLLGDFNRFAERQGVVHCIKKYLERGS